MKIEKINENKIRCILTRDDLEVRHIKISEIAFGSEKARSLFRDMMEQASHQFGFEADNIPLMIEAIPMPNECIILDITKVSDPEELDTRFSRFSQSSVEPGEELPIPKDFLPDGADEVIDLFQKLLEHRLKMPRRKTENSRLRNLPANWICESYICSRNWILCWRLPMFLQVFITVQTVCIKILTPRSIV